MNAAIQYQSANSAPLPALSAVVETIPNAPQETILSDGLTLSATDTGLIIHRSGAPVCWIVAGYHDGQQDLQRKRCDFVDVAYFRETQRGEHLDTRDFLNLEEAMVFVSEVFGGEQ